MNAPSPTIESLVFHEVDRDRWDDLAKLFEARGGPKWCWCMVWRATPEERKRPKRATYKSTLMGRVMDNVPIGILGYLDGEPVAWCSIAPRETYLRLLPRGTPPDHLRDVWSIACFFVPARLRGQGVTGRLIDAAVAHARSRGAAVVEAYPVDAESPSYGFMGRVSSFAAAGFESAGDAGTRRHIMRLFV